MAQTSATSFVSLFKKPHSTGILDMKWVNFACQNHLLGDEHSWLQTVLVWTAGYQGRDPLPVSMTSSQVGLLESGLQLLTNEMTLKKGSFQHFGSRRTQVNKTDEPETIRIEAANLEQMLHIYHIFRINSGNWATKHVWKILHPPQIRYLEDLQISWSSGTNDDWGRKSNHSFSIPLLICSLQPQTTWFNGNKLTGMEDVW